MQLAVPVIGQVPGEELREERCLDELHAHPIIRKLRMLVKRGSRAAAWLPAEPPSGLRLSPETARAERVTPRGRLSAVAAARRRTATVCASE